MKTWICMVLMCAGTASTVGQNIIGGQSTGPNDYPWFAGLAYSDEPDLFNAHYCGGSLISPEWVITASHCLVDDWDNILDSVTKPNELDLLFEVHVLSSPKAGFKRIRAEEVYLHPNYDNYSLDHDIALIKLSSPVLLETIFLPNQGDESLTSHGVTHTAVGWGIIDDNAGEWADTLQEVDVPIINRDTCNQPFAYDGEVFQSMICAGFMQGGKDACGGDSGGPLFTIDNGDKVLSGIVSWGYECAAKNLPGVYTEVSDYVNWINSVMSPPASNTGNNTPVDLKVWFNEQLQQIEFGQKIENNEVLDLISMEGKRIKTFTDHVESVSTTEIKPGMYFVVLKSPHRYGVAKVMVNR